uniref:ZP domain-containing protein n=1 Tax=Caenorhabditis tropicalis TaxID=1561998 RepID=A0A1I7URL6_9PELO
MFQMRLVCLLICLLINPISTSYIEEPYHTLEVPFEVINGTETTEEVFLEFYCHTVTYTKELAIKMRVEADTDLSFAADKCGKRLFETSTDIQNATYYFNREWVQTMLTGIRKTCTVQNEYSINFTMACSESCKGTIYFSFIELKQEELIGIADKTNPMEGTIPFRTAGDGEPTTISSDIGNIIDAVYMNSRLRFVLHMQYSTAFTLEIGKCGLVVMRLEGTDRMFSYNFIWEESKLLRMAKATQCPDNYQLDVIDYTMTSEVAGSGAVTFLMTRTKKKMENHPENEYGLMELALGIPKHHIPPTQSSRCISFLIISLFLVMMAM